MPEFITMLVPCRGSSTVRHIPDDSAFVNAISSCGKMPLECDRFVNNP
jgi:hypothetical protein